MRLPRKRKKKIKKENPTSYKWIMGFINLSFWTRKCAASINEANKALNLLKVV